MTQTTILIECRVRILLEKGFRVLQIEEVTKGVSLYHCALNRPYLRNSWCKAYYRFWWALSRSRCTLYRSKIFLSKIHNKEFCVL